MKAQDMFGLAIRLIGLVFLYQSLSSVPTAINSICPLFPHFYWTNVFPSVILVGWPLLAAYILLRHTPRLIDFSYRQELKEKPVSIQG